jgi:hypothetical protein
MESVWILPFERLTNRNRFCEIPANRDFEIESDSDFGNGSRNPLSWPNWDPGIPAKSGSESAGGEIPNISSFPIPARSGWENPGYFPGLIVAGRGGIRDLGGLGVEVFNIERP